MKIQPYQTSLKKEWDEFIQASPQAWAMHLRGFLDAVNAAWHEPDFSFVIRDEGKIVCAVPLQYRAYDGSLRSAGRAWAGPAISDGFNTDATWSLILREVRRVGSLVNARNWLFACNSLATIGTLPMIEVDSFEHTVQVIDTSTGAESVLQGMSKDARRLVRKAKESELQVFRISDAEQALDLYYPIHQETYARTSEQPHPKKYFKGIFDSLIGSAISRVWAVEHNNNVIALVNIAVFKNAAWYWTGCSTQQGLDMYANYLLQSEVLAHLSNEGISRYETGETFTSGTNGKLYGLSMFKKKFGGNTALFKEYRVNLQPVRSRIRSILARGASR